jgi:hypothetical protein
MIRDANKFDRQDILEIWTEFRDSASFPELANAIKIENVGKVVDHIFAGAGRIFYSPQKGFLMSIITPSIWDHEVFVLNELAWFVRKEFRNTSIGYRLFMAYIEYGKALKKSGKIRYFTMTKLDVSQNFDYSRYGFRPKDITWVQ